MIGDNIKKYRKRAGLTQKQLAEKLGLAEVTIHQYESNKREPKFDTLIRIADVLNVPLDLITSLTREDHAKALSQEADENQAFIDYLESLGYDCIDASLMYGEDYDADMVIYLQDKNTEINISNSEFEDLMDYTESQIDLEISRLLKHKQKNQE